MNAQAYDQYRKASVETVAPEKLLLMLYDGAIKKICNAKIAIGDKDINRAHQEIMKAEDIIMELMCTLNMDYEISNGLFSLYEYLHNQLVQANFKKDIELLDEVEGFLSELRDAWREAMKTMKTTGLAPVEAPKKAVQNDPANAVEIAAVSEAAKPETVPANKGAYPSSPISINKLAYGSVPATKTFSNNIPPEQRQGINIKG